MKAAVSERYGPPEVIEIRDVPKPAPGPAEVLVRVCTSTVTRTDLGMLRPHPWFVRLFEGLWRPRRRILGFDFAGVVEARGRDATKFERGDRVFGLSVPGFGAHAEYLCVPEDGAVALVPGGKAFHEVVACEGAYYADTCMKVLGLEAGDSILIYGASGAIGTAAVQLAKARGADVTAVVPTHCLELARALGADHTIDYTVRDFTEVGKRFACVLDAVGKTT